LSILTHTPTKMVSQQAGVSPEALSASGRSSDKLSLPALQSKMKSDPEGYESELVLVHSQFKSSLELFRQQAALNFTSISGIGSDPSVAKDLGDRAMLLAHVTPFYPQHLADFPSQLADFLASSARSLPSGLRCHITQALILLANRKVISKFCKNLKEKRCGVEFETSRCCFFRWLRSKQP
jgi:protein SDA1